MTKNDYLEQIKLLTIKRLPHKIIIASDIQVICKNIGFEIIQFVEERIGHEMRIATRQRQIAFVSPQLDLKNLHYTKFRVR